MTPDNRSEQKEWPKRTAEKRPLFASRQKWLEILPYLSKPELDKCREVCNWTDRLIDKCTGKELKQRRELDSLFIVPAQVDYDGVQTTRLDMDKWLEDEEDMAKIKTKAQELIGETIYLYEPDEEVVRTTIEPEFEHYLYVDVKNRLDEEGALLMARLMPRITPPTTVFSHVLLFFDATPELSADAPHGGSYFNPAIFLSGADSEDGGQAKLTARELCLQPAMLEESSRGMIRTAERTVCCQVLDLVYNPTDLEGFYDFLQQVAVARPLNAPARIIAEDMEDGRLDEILNFFTDGMPDYESAAPCLRLTIDETAAWPESLPMERAVNERGQQLEERLYMFHHLHNSHSGERLKVEVRGSFGSDEHGGCCEEREECLRVAEMVLYFRLDSDDK